MHINGSRNPAHGPRHSCSRPPARAGGSSKVRRLRANVGNNHNGNDHPEKVAAAPRPQDAHRVKALRRIAGRLKRLSWTPALLALLLDELYVDDLYTDLVGDPDTIPPHDYASAVAVAIALRHSWRPDDLEAIADRLGVLRERPKPQAPPRGKRPLRTPP